MKLKLITGILIAIASTQAMALQELNCSNGDRTLVREEKEIWGANPINHYIKDELVKNAQEIFDNKSKHIISRKINAADGSGDEVYTIKLTLIDENNQATTDFVICHKWWDKNID